MSPQVKERRYTPYRRLDGALVARCSMHSGEGVETRGTRCVNEDVRTRRVDKRNSARDVKDLAEPCAATSWIVGHPHHEFGKLVCRRLSVAEGDQLLLW